MLILTTLMYDFISTDLQLMKMTIHSTLRHHVNQSDILNKYSVVSRPTVVCRAAKKVSAPHCEYIEKKKENSIFVHA